MGNLDSILAELDQMPVQVAETADSAESRKRSGSALADSWRSRGGKSIAQNRQLYAEQEPLIYPVEALGSLLGGAAQAIAQHVQAPLPMACQSVLAVAALAAQAHVNVKRGPIGLGPVSLFCITVAESGDRKSAVDKLALKPVREYEKQRAENAKRERADYEAELERWSAERGATAKQMGKAADKGMTDSERDTFKQELEIFELTKPTPPVVSWLTFQEPNAEGIWKHYQAALPNAGLFTDEALGFFSGHGMAEKEAKGRMITMLSKLWDGDPLTRTRGASGESGVIYDRRLSAHLMMQPVVADQVMSDPLMLDQGFLPRFLICRVKTMAGSRSLTPEKLANSADTDPAIQSYWQAIRQLMEQEPQIDESTGGLMLSDMAIQGEALIEWMYLHNGIEKELGDGGRYRSVKAFGSKAAEQAARIAAVLAYTEQVNIGREHIQRAGKIIAYYLDSMLRGMDEAAEETEWRQASNLYNYVQESMGGAVHCSDFNRLPRAFRSAATARKMLNLLADEGYLRVTDKGPKGPSRWEQLL